MSKNLVILSSIALFALSTASFAQKNEHSGGEEGEAIRRDQLDPRSIRFEGGEAIRRGQLDPNSIRFEGGEAIRRGQLDSNSIRFEGGEAIRRGQLDSNSIRFERADSDKILMSAELFQAPPEHRAFAPTAQHIVDACQAKAPATETELAKGNLCFQLQLNNLMQPGVIAVDVFAALLAEASPCDSIARQTDEELAESRHSRDQVANLLDADGEGDMKIRRERTLSEQPKSAAFSAHRCYVEAYSRFTSLKR